MDKETRLRIELLHCIGWMFFHRCRSHLWRDQIDAGRLALPEDVPKETAFTGPGSYLTDDFQRIFRALGCLQINDPIYDNMVRFRFAFQERNLREHLEASGRLEAIPRDDLFTTFLRWASELGRGFVSFSLGREAIGSLPIVQSDFPAPPHFNRAIDALCDCGFCARVENGHRWTEAIRSYMESAHLWVGEKTRDEIREAELIEIWDSMPAKLKAPYVKELKGHFDVLTFALLMSHFWYRGTWHEKPESLHRVRLGAASFKGEHIPTAKELFDLHAKGKLKS